MTRLHHVVALVGLGAVGCTESDRGLVILQNQAIGDDECLASGNPGDAARGQGLLAPNAPSGYVFTPVVRSLIAESDTRERLIFIEGAEVEVSDASGALIAEFTEPYAATITPGDTVGMVFPITPSGLGAGNYTSTIILYGTLEGGGVESEPFNYPIEVTDSAVNLGPCSELAPGYEGQLVGSACNVYQDGGLECCTDGADLVCPAEGPPLPPA